MGENGIDAIQNEKLLGQELQHTIGIDRNGRPVIFIRPGKIDLRNATLNRKPHDAIRSNFELVEQMVTRARTLIVTQIVVIIDLTGFNYRRYVICRDCLRLGQEIGETVETTYPEIVAALFFINTPHTFELILLIFSLVTLNLIKIILPPSSRKVLHVYGFDKVKWTDALLRWISPDELSTLLGTDVVPNQNTIHYSQHDSKVYEEGDMTLPISNYLQKLQYANSSAKKHLFRQSLPFATFLSTLFYLIV